MVVPLPDETEVQCNAYEHALGWSAVGETGGAIVVGAISGSAYIFPGDQTDNFTPEMPHQIIPPAHTVTKGTGGEWTGSPAYASSETTFTDSGADFQAYMVGWGREATAPQERNVFRGIQADVELPSYLEIVEVVSATAIKVKGDADTLATSGSTYRLHAPPGVSATTGALITGLEEAGSRWLWAGYEYMPPMVGFHNPEGQDPGTYGAQPGTNKVGSYHCWNRVYEPATGRWTTPDPAMTPWSNFQDYVGSNPHGRTDPSGLFTVDVYEGFDSVEDWGADTDDEADALEEAADKAGGLGATTKNAKKDDLDRGLAALGKDGIFIFIGHSNKSGIRGKENTKAAAGGVGAVGAVVGGGLGLRAGWWGGIIGGLGGGAVGAAVGAVVAPSETLEGDELDGAATLAEGVVILMGCSSFHLKDKFKNAQCFCGYRSVCSIKEKIKKDAGNLASVIAAIPKGQCRSWSWIIQEMNKKDVDRKPLAQDWVEMECTDSCKKAQLCNK